MLITELKNNHLLKVYKFGTQGWNDLLLCYMTFQLFSKPNKI